jgi:hypothetical protein
LLCGYLLKVATPDVRPLQRPDTLTLFPTFDEELYTFGQDAADA